MITNAFEFNSQDKVISSGPADLVDGYQTTSTNGLNDAYIFKQYLRQDQGFKETLREIIQKAQTYSTDQLTEDQKYQIEDRLLNRYISNINIRKTFFTNPNTNLVAYNILPDDLMSLINKKPIGYYRPSHEVNLSYNLIQAGYALIDFISRMKTITAFENFLNNYQADLNSRKPIYFNSQWGDIETSFENTKSITRMRDTIWAGMLLSRLSRILSVGLQMSILNSSGYLNNPILPNGKYIAELEKALRKVDVARSGVIVGSEIINILAHIENGSAVLSYRGKQLLLLGSVLNIAQAIMGLVSISTKRANGYQQYWGKGIDDLLYGAAITGMIGALADGVYRVIDLVASTIFEEVTTSAGLITKFKFSNSPSFIKIANKLYFSKAIQGAENALRAAGIAASTSKAAAAINLFGVVFGVIAIAASITAYALFMSVYTKLYQDALKEGKTTTALMYFLDMVLIQTPALYLSVIGTALSMTKGLAPLGFALEMAALILVSIPSPATIHRWNMMNERAETIRKEASLYIQYGWDGDLDLANIIDLQTAVEIGFSVGTLVNIPLLIVNAFGGFDGVYRRMKEDYKQALIKKWGSMEKYYEAGVNSRLEALFHEKDTVSMFKAMGSSSYNNRVLGIASYIPDAKILENAALFYELGTVDFKKTAAYQYLNGLYQKALIEIDVANGKFDISTNASSQYVFFISTLTVAGTLSTSTKPDGKNTSLVTVSTDKLGAWTFSDQANTSTVLDMRMTAASVGDDKTVGDNARKNKDTEKLTSEIRTRTVLNMYGGDDVILLTSRPFDVDGGSGINGVDYRNAAMSEYPGEYIITATDAQTYDYTVTKRAVNKETIQFTDNAAFKDGKKTINVDFKNYALELAKHEETDNLKNIQWLRGARVKTIYTGNDLDELFYAESIGKNSSYDMKGGTNTLDFNAKEITGGIKVLLNNPGEGFVNKLSNFNSSQLNVNDSFKGVNNFILTNEDDYFDGSANSEYISAGYGNDTINAQGGNDTIAVSHDPAYRYILIRRKTDGVKQYLGLEEFEVYSEGKNVALNAKVVSSGETWGDDDSQKKQHKKENLVDGVVDGSSIYASKTTNGDEWVMIDLGQSYSIDYVKAFSRRESNRPQSSNLRIFVSNTDLSAYGTDLTALSRYSASKADISNFYEITTQGNYVSSVDLSNVQLNASDFTSLPAYSTGKKINAGDGNDSVDYQNEKKNNQRFCGHRCRFKQSK